MKLIEVASCLFKSYLVVGYESRQTSKAITKLLLFMLEGPQLYTMFPFTVTLLANLVT